MKSKYRHIIIVKIIITHFLYTIYWLISVILISDQFELVYYILKSWL